MTDLSKTFGCINHKLVIAKLATFGFDYASLRFVHKYLTERERRTKINNVYSSYSDITRGVSQGSLLGSLLFNIDTCDMFLGDSDIASYCNDNTPYANDVSENLVKNILGSSCSGLFKLFRENHLKSNYDTYHPIFKAIISIGAIKKNCSNEKLIRAFLLKVTYHLFAGKASQKLHVLSSVRNYMDPDKRR